MNRIRVAHVNKTIDESASEPGVERGWIAFERLSLAGHRWPYYEIDGGRPGPRLCVTGGVHVNELASMEASLRLADAFPPAELTGTVAVLPVVNLPALYDHVKDICPVDGKSIHWQFPGDPGGTFSEALAHAILHDWSASADVLIDLHGGDLHEAFSTYVVWQQSGDPDLDARSEALARCFDADYIVGLAPEMMDAPGRCCTAAARQGRLSLVVEGGSEARLTDEHVRFHRDGVVAVARALGMIEGATDPPRRPQTAIAAYRFLTAPQDGLLTAVVAPGSPVRQGQKLFTRRDLFGREIGEVSAPVSGHLIWCSSHLAARAGAWIGAIGIPPEED